MLHYESERREFVRVKAAIEVRYMFLSNSDVEVSGDVHEGVTQNISGGGILLVGKIPNLQWIPDLLMQKLVIGVNIYLLDSDEPVKALTRVAWVEAFEESSMKCSFGLTFREITKDQQDRILRYVIKAQMPA